MLMLFAWLLVSCGSGTSNGTKQGGSGRTGDRCMASEDCASLLCVRLTADAGVCSILCRDDVGCPNSDNWACLQSSTIAASVCACRVLSDSEVCGDGIDNDCNSLVDDCQMCGGRPVPQNDPENCGGCGKACRSDQRCERGVCKCPLESPLECAGACTDSQYDDLNCGRCGAACPLGQTCSEGECACPSLAVPDYCPAAGCVSLQTNEDHCGTCDTACTLGQACSGGKCVCPAGSPADFCEGVGCVDLQTDAKNCGKCGSACVSTQACQAGACACPAGQTLCGDVCVDLKNDTEHCGACDQACGPALACIQGECSCTAAGYAVCGSTCAKLDSDSLHCGACEKECAAGEACRGSQCVCDSGLYCEGECMPANDDQNCGACGKACAAGQQYQAGQCSCVGFGLTACGDECYSLASDEQHCGSCITACKNTEQCGVLGCACPNGQSFCDNANACVSLSSDEQHCGACGTTCKPTEVCSNSSCQCPSAGALYCASQKACTDTLSNEKHCGNCDAACKPTEECNGGQCACPNAKTFCAKANACVDFASDNLNCGACDKACPAATHCSNSQCVCDTVGKTLCGNVCYDLQTDADHCGACANDCGLNFSCIGGTCRCPQPTLGTEVQVTSSGDNTDPIAVWDGTHVGVAYAGYSYLVYDNVRFLLLNPDGTLVANSIIDVGQNREAYDLTWNGTEYAAVAESFNGILFRRIAASGVPIGAGVELSLFPESVDDFVRVGWSSKQGGYVLFWDGGYPGSVFAQRIGGDASTPAARQSWDVFRGGRGTNVVAAPDGTLGLTFLQDDDLDSARLDPTGAPVNPLVVLDTYHTTSLNNSIVHDANGFVSAWAKQKNILLNRGDALNGPALATSIPESGSIDAVKMAQTNNSLSIGWAQALGVVGLDGSHRFRFQRFTQPDAVTGAVRPITDAMDIVAAHAQSVVSLVSTGPYRLLAVWSDGRPNDSTHSIYAVPIDLHSCP